MAYDYTLVGNSYLPDHPLALSATEDIQGHQTLGEKGQGCHGRRIAVWCPCHSPRRHHRHGQHHRCRHSHRPRWSGSRALVLAHRCVWYLHQICRGTACREISCEDSQGQNARRSDVCPGEGTGLEVARHPLRPLRRPRLFRHRKYGAGERHLLTSRARWSPSSAQPSSSVV